MTYIKRISDNYLKADLLDGDIIQHTEINEIESITKTGINANYEDIQRISDGTLISGNSTLLCGCSLSKQSIEVLQNNDGKIPTSKQVKTYVDLAVTGASVPIASNEVLGKVKSDNNGIVISESGIISISTEGFDATKTQVLKNINGVIQWVEE
jgi:hypothetical protein